MLENFFVTMLEVSAVISIIIFTLKLLSTFLNRFYAAKWRYFIWGILAIRLVIPFDLSLPETMIQVNVPSVSVSDVQTALPQNVSALFTPTIAPAETMQQSNLSLIKLLMILWLVGMVVFILVQLTGYFAFKKQVWRWNRSIESQRIFGCIQSLSTQMKIAKQVPAFINEKVTSPMMMGVFHPTLLLPRDDYTAADLSFIMQHEFIHYKRHDLWYKLLLMIANAVHWFNPFVYLMIHEANRDLELSCDDGVTKDRNADERKAYCETILTSIHFGKMKRSAFTTNFYGGTKTMKERFTNIFDRKKKHSGILMVAIILVTVLLSGTLVGFTAAKDNNDSSVENINLTVTGCNVIVKTSGDNVVNSTPGSSEFQYEIDETIHKLTATQNGSTMNIELKSTGKSSESITDMAIIFIPQKQYNKITVVGNGAGVSLPPLNADFSMISNKGAMSVSVSKGFNKTIDFTSIGSSGSLVFSALADNYTLNMNVKKSAVSVPSEFTAYVQQPKYKYVKGTGTAKININLEKSSFSIVTSKKKSKIAPTKLPILIKKLEKVQRYGPFQLAKGDTWTPSLTWEGKTNKGFYVASQLTSKGDSFVNGQLQQRMKSGTFDKPMIIPSDGEYWFFVGNRDRGESKIKNVKGTISFITH